MKLSDFLKSTIDPLQIKNNDLEAALQASALREIEIPDEVKDKFDRTYFTKDRALNDEDINRSLQKEARGYVFGSIDQKLMKLFPMLNEEDVAEINNEKNTLVKVDLLNKAIQKIKESGHNEDAKKASARAREIESQLRAELDKLQKDLVNKDEAFKKERSKIELNYALREKIKSVKLAPEFDSDARKKEFLANSTIDTLTKNFVLEFDETNRSDIKLLKDVDGHLKEVFEGNTKITLDQLIAKELEPFTQKSNAGATQTQNTPAETFKTPSDKPLTLRDMQMAGATY